jgi:hypothetical protein
MHVYHRHLSQVSLPFFQSLFIIIIVLCHYQTAPEGIAVIYTTTPFQLLYSTFLSYMTRAWGMPTSFVHNLFFTPCERLGTTGSPLPPMGHS